MASISSNKRNNRATLATSNNIYLPTPYTTPPLQRQCLSDSLQSFNPSHGSGSSSWMLWRDPNSPAYYQGENKNRLCGVLLAVVVFLVIVAVLAIAGLAVYMGALRIDAASNRNNTKQQKLIKDDRSLEIRNGVLRKVSSSHNLSAPHTVHLKKLNASETEPVEDLPIIEGSFNVLGVELSKGNDSAENQTDVDSAIFAENSQQSSGTAGAEGKNVTVDDLFIVGEVMEVKGREENDENFTKSSNFERHQSGSIHEESTQSNAVTVIREENTKVDERESEERSYPQRDEIVTNSSAGVESGSTQTLLVLEPLPTQIIQEKDQALFQVSGAKTERLGLQKHESTTNTLSSTTKLPPASTKRTHVTDSEESAAKQGGSIPSAEKDQISRGVVSDLPKINQKINSEPAGLPDTSAVRSLSNGTISTSISDEATFQTRFPPRQRVTVLPEQRNVSDNASVNVETKNASSTDSEEDGGVDLDPNSMLRRMGPILPAPEQDLGKGTQIRYSDPSQGDRGNAMVLNPASPIGQNNPMNPAVLSTNTYKDRYQHLSAGSKIRPHYGTKIVDAQVRDTNPSKEGITLDKHTKDSDQRLSGIAVKSAADVETSALALAPGLEPALAPAPAPSQDTVSSIEDGWRPMVPMDFAIASHRPDMDLHEHTPVPQTSDQLSHVHLQVSNANQAMPTSVLTADVNGSVSFTRNNSSSTGKPGTLLTSQGNANERNISKSNAAEVIRKIIADSYNWPELPIMQQFSNLGNFLRKDDKPNEFSQPQTTKQVVSSTTTKAPKTSTPVRSEPEDEFENHGIALPVDGIPAELLVEEKSAITVVTEDKDIGVVVATLKPPKSNSGIGRPLRPRPKFDTTAPTTTTTTTTTTIRITTPTTSSTTTPAPTKALPLSTTSPPRQTPPKAHQRPSIYSITTTKTSKITTPLKSTAIRSNRTKTTTTRPALSSSTQSDVVTRKSVHVSFSDKTNKDDRRNETTHYVKINVRQENKIVPNRSNGVGSHNAYHILPPKTATTTRPKPKGPVRITSSNGTVRISTMPPKRRNSTSLGAKPTSNQRKENTTLPVSTKSNHDLSYIASKITETNFYPVTYFPLLMNSTKHVGESNRHPKMSSFNDTTASSGSSLQKSPSPATKSQVTEGASDKQVAGDTEIRMSLEDIVRNYRTKITSSQNSKSNRNYSITYEELQDKQNLNTPDIESAAKEEESQVHHQHKTSVNKSKPLVQDDHELPEPTQNTPKVIVSASSRVQDRTVETKPSGTSGHYLLSPSNSDNKATDPGTSKLFQNYPKIIQSFSPGMQNSAIGIRNSSSEKYISKLTTHLPFTSTTKGLPNNNIHRINQTSDENRFTESFHSSYKESTKHSPTIQEKIISSLEISKPSHRENDKDMNYDAFKDLSFPLEDAIVNAISKFATVHVSAVVKNTSSGIFNSQNANVDIAGNNLTEGSINMTSNKQDKLNTTSHKEWSKANSTWLPGNSKEISSEQGEKLRPNFTLNQNGIPILTKIYTKATDAELTNMNVTQDGIKTELSKNQTECTGIICGNNECVALQSRCNQLVDCSDGADEKDCTCADYLKAQYLTRKLCDGVVDCWDFTDENNCEWCSPGQFVCPNSQMCIDRNKLCDGNRDCPYGDDEKQCVTIAPTLSNATDFPYHQEGYLMVRKQGKWGKLCLQNFNSVVSDSHTTWEVKDLGKAVCKAMTFSDFDRVERMVDATGRSDDDSLYYELSYSPEDTNASTARSSLTFHESPCAQKEVVHVKCRDLECGIRPQAVSQWARSRRSRIVGGGNSGPGSWPWQAALYKEGEFQCGATLISEQWLVSAGHCFYHALDDYWVARLGTLRRGTNFPSPYEQLRPISNIILHPRYVDSGFINDISLLRMKEPVAFSDYVRPICLPQPNSVLKDGKLCTVVGWGQLFEVGRIFPDTLQEVQLPIISTGECRKRTLFLPLYRVTDNMFCAGFDRGGRDACLGDSGGPLMCQEADGHWSLYGVTSNGYGCARANRPGVYTKVAKYVVWIRTSMNLLMQLRESKAACKGHRCPLGECLPRSRVCNGYMECSDGSDEKDCW